MDEEEELVIDQSRDSMDPQKNADKECSLSDLSRVVESGHVSWLSLFSKQSNSEVSSTPPTVPSFSSVSTTTVSHNNGDKDSKERRRAADRVYYKARRARETEEEATARRAREAARKRARMASLTAEQHEEILARERERRAIKKASMSAEQYEEIRARDRKRRAIKKAKQKEEMAELEKVAVLHSALKYGKESTPKASSAFHHEFDETVHFDIPSVMTSSESEKGHL